MAGNFDDASSEPRDIGEVANVAGGVRPSPEVDSFDTAGKEFVNDCLVVVNDQRVEERRDTGRERWKERRDKVTESPLKKKIVSSLNLPNLIEILGERNAKCKPRHSQ